MSDTSSDPARPGDQFEHAFGAGRGNGRLPESWKDAALDLHSAISQALFALDNADLLPLEERAELAIEVLRDAQRDMALTHPPDDEAGWYRTQRRVGA